MGEGWVLVPGTLANWPRRGAATRMKTAGTRLCLAQEEAGADISGAMAVAGGLEIPGGSLGQQGWTSEQTA